MRLTIYSTTRAAHVGVGQLVDGGEHGPVLVDETREKREEGGDVVVSILGRAPGSTSQRRVHLRYAPGDVVRLVPDAEAAAAVWDEIVNAVGQAALRWDEMHDDAGTGITEEAPYKAISGAVQVRLRGTRYTVDPLPEDEPDATSTSSTDDGTPPADA